jgi:hypothetical protein
MDEKWVHYFTLAIEATQQCKGWQHPNLTLHSCLPPPKNAKYVPLAGKVMTSVLKGIGGTCIF